MFRLVIVDDEPNLVEGLFDLFSKLILPEAEIFRAYSAWEVYNLLMSRPIDLIISDIEMPGMSGLEMLKYVEQVCPACKVIFLTGYATFAWIQEALRHPCCVDYLLKTQGDEAVVAAVETQMARLDTENGQKRLLQRIQEQAENPDSILHFNPDNNHTPGLEMDHPVYLCIGKRNGIGMTGQMFLFALKLFLTDQIHALRVVEVFSMGRDAYGILIQQHISDVSVPDIYSFLRARLENVQDRLEKVGEYVNFVFQETPCSFQSSSHQLQKLLEVLESHNQQDARIILCNRHDQLSDKENGQTLVSWISQYVQEHLADANLSLSTVAEKTYYAPAYLSRLFKQQTGDNFSVFIANTRLNEACRLLKEGKYTAQEIGRMVGFESPSYFSAFFKRMTHLTPLQYQRKKSDGSS